MRDLTIGEATRQAGVGVETIRFYERRGLIEQPRKPQDSSFRVYLPEQIKRIKFIRQAQRTGFSLRETEELLSLRADPKADCSEVRQQAVAKLDEVGHKSEQLRRIESALKALIAVCPGRGGVETCTILDTLADPTHGHVQSIEADGVLSAVPPTRKQQNGTSGIDGQKQGRALRSPQS